MSTSVTITTVATYPPSTDPLNPTTLNGNGPWAVVGTTNLASQNDVLTWQKGMDNPNDISKGTLPNWNFNLLSTDIPKDGLTYCFMVTGVLGSNLQDSDSKVAYVRRPRDQKGDA